MPLMNYGVLVGRPVDRRTEGGTDTPHYQIHVRGGEVDFRVAVNVLSQQQPSELLYLADEAFNHPLLGPLSDLTDGFTLLPSQPGGVALDFIRANLFDKQAMRAVPSSARAGQRSGRFARPLRGTCHWRSSSEVVRLRATMGTRTDEARQDLRVLTRQWGA